MDALDALVFVQWRQIQILNQTSKCAKIDHFNLNLNIFFPFSRDLLLRHYRSRFVALEGHGLLVVRFGEDSI